MVGTLGSLTRPDRGPDETDRDRPRRDHDTHHRRHTERGPTRSTPQPMAKRSTTPPPEEIAERIVDIDV